MHLKSIITVFLLCLYILCTAQTKTLTGVVKDRVSGTVTDTQDQPLPGVTVFVKGTFRGTTTGADGRYSLTNVPASAVLSFSFVGFKTQEIPFEGQTRLNIQMQEDVTTLSEVTVNAGYYTVKDREHRPGNSQRTGKPAGKQCPLIGSGAYGGGQHYPGQRGTGRWLQHPDQRYQQPAPGWQLPDVHY